MAGRKTDRLTATAVKGNKLGSGLHVDGNGLMLQVSVGGAKSWILRTVVHGKRRDMGLGGLSTVSLAEARELARQFRAIARKGGDPFAERAKANRHAPSFREAAEIVHNDHAPSWRNKKHIDQWINTLKAYAFPTLGETRVDQIRSEHIVRTLTPIWLTKPETGRRVLQRIGTVLLWAKGHGFRPDSPTDEIRAAHKALPRQSDKPRHHKALPYTDVPQFIAKFRSNGASESIKLALEYLILTAARTGEVLGAKWPEIDRKRKTWTIPASRMKAKREHVVPLSERCMQLLEAAQTFKEDDKGYVFPGTLSGKPLSNMALLMPIRRMGDDITAHGFRSTFRVWCAEQTHHPREVAEAALAHVVKDATEAAYMRSTFFEKRRELMNEWAAHVTTSRAKPKRQTKRHR